MAEPLDDGHRLVRMAGQAEAVGDEESGALPVSLADVEIVLRLGLQFPCLLDEVGRQPVHVDLEREPVHGEQDLLPPAVAQSIRGRDPCLDQLE